MARVRRFIQHGRFVLVLAGFVSFAGSVLPGAVQDANRSAQTASKEAPAYEVASIKTHPPGYWPTSETRRFTAEGVVWDNTHIQDVIVRAFDLRDPTFTYQARVIPGGPKWIESDWYDIEAKMSDEIAPSTPSSIPRSGRR